MTKEEIRLKEARDNNVPWKKWGPYLSEHQWGTVCSSTNTSTVTAGQGLGPAIKPDGRGWWPL